MVFLHEVLQTDVASVLFCLGCVWLQRQPLLHRLHRLHRLLHRLLCVDYLEQKEGDLVQEKKCLEQKEDYLEQKEADLVQEKKYWAKLRQVQKLMLVVVRLKIVRRGEELLKMEGQCSVLKLEAEIWVWRQPQIFGREEDSDTAGLGPFQITKVNSFIC